MSSITSGPGGQEVHGSGGLNGMLVGPSADARPDRRLRREDPRAAPGNYIAQPTLALSTCRPSWEMAWPRRHVDLRPSCWWARQSKLVPGGLTRVALKEGCLW